MTHKKALLLREGDYILCNTTSPKSSRTCNEAYTKGKLYKVSHYVLAYDSIYTQLDNNGNLRNGWGIQFFDFVNDSKAVKILFKEVTSVNAKVRSS